MSLAPYIRILGRGPSRSRPLTQDEAREAMEIILAGDADPVAIGALLMLMRYRGETAPEIAGFTQAVQAGLDPGWAGLHVALDWPTFAAGRTRGAPWFLLSAKLVADAGLPVMLHGWNSHQNPVASVRAALAPLRIPEARTPAEAEAALRDRSIVYVPAEALNEPALDLIKLRDVLGLRSCLNTVMRMINPAGADGLVQGVFHPSYRDLQSDAAELLGQKRLSVIKGGGGEFERHPAKSITLMGLVDGVRSEQVIDPTHDATRRLHDPDLAQVDPVELWNGTVDDDFATACVIGTAALALMTCGLDHDTAHDRAASLWQTREPCLNA